MKNDKKRVKQSSETYPQSSSKSFSITNLTKLKQNKKKTNANSKLTKKICVSVSLSALVLSNHSIQQQSTNQISISIGNELEDIDFAVSLDEQIEFVSIYAPKIFQSYYEMERSCEIKPYLLKHSGITDNSRSYVINIMMRVSRKMKLENDTLHTSVNILDRYFSQCSYMVSDSIDLLLISTTCVMIAIKYIESGGNADDYFDLMTCIKESRLKKKDLVSCEAKVMTTISWSIFSPTTFTYIDRFLRASKANDLERSIAQCICDRALLGYSLLRYLPSHLAATFVLLSREINKREILWTSTLIYYTSYNIRDLFECREECISIFNQNDDNEVRKKFPVVYDYILARIP